MKRLSQFVLIGALIAAATGCTSSKTGASDEGPASGPTTAVSLGAKLGCAVQESDGENQLFTREDVTCDYSGESINIVTFSSSGAKANYLEAAGEFGGIYVEGPDWAVGVEQQATAAKVAAALGGSVR